MPLSVLDRPFFQILIVMPRLPDTIIIGLGALDASGAGSSLRLEKQLFPIINMHPNIFGNTSFKSINRKFNA